ncbi:MAG: hypothetical protein RLZZ398_1961 [Verrucomicrobiota bacterium]
MSRRFTKIGESHDLVGCEQPVLRMTPLPTFLARLDRFETGIVGSPQHSMCVATPVAPSDRGSLEELLAATFAKSSGVRRDQVPPTRLASDRSNRVGRSPPGSSAKWEIPPPPSCAGLGDFSLRSIAAPATP